MEIREPNEHELLTLWGAGYAEHPGGPRVNDGGDRGGIEAGAGCWSMPWSSDGVAFPVNPTTQKRYGGGNVLALMTSALVAGWPCGQWATYMQWAGIGAQVRKGERSTGCLFWSVKEDRITVEDEKTGEPVELSALPRFRTRAFVVFNAAQVDG